MASSRRPTDARYRMGTMAEDKKKPPTLKEAPATQKISKEELAALIKKAEEEDPDKDKKKPKPKT